MRPSVALGVSSPETGDFLRRLLITNAIRIAAVARDPSEFRGCAASLLLLSDDFDSGGGRSTLRRVCRGFAPGPVVVVAGGRDTQRSAMRAGAAGVVALDDAERTLVPTIHAAISGQLAVPRALISDVVMPALSYREKQVLRLVVLGRTNAQIAGELFLSESTVKSHLSSLFDKLGVRSRSEAATLVLSGHAGLRDVVLSVPEDSNQRPPARVGA